MSSVLSMQRFGSIKTELVRLESYKNLAEKRKLPTLKELMGQDYPEQHRIFLDDYELRFAIGGERYRFIFYRNFMTDFGSVPPRFRHLVDNDDPACIDAFLVHDALFQTHFFEENPGEATRAGWRKSNEIMRELMKAQSYPKFRAFLAWFGVSTGIGWRNYKNRTSFDEKISRFVSIKIDARDQEFFRK